MEVYDYQLSGESAWFEQRMAEYGKISLVIFRFVLSQCLNLFSVPMSLDNVLLDFCEITKRDIDPNHGRKWFRNVYIEGVGSLGTCSDPDEPYMPRATECVKIEDDMGEAVGDSSSGYTALGVTIVAWLPVSLVLMVW
jgi:hypothetical protein